MHVTETACEALSQMLGQRGDAERCLRLSTTHGNYRFILDQPIDQDILFRHDTRVVLAVSETVSRDLWGITVDCATDDGRQKLIFRKAKHGEPLDVIKDDAELVPPQWRANQHEALLAEIAEIGRQIASLRGTKSSLREQVAVLEAKKQEKWDAIRAIWAGDGGWHKLNGTNGNGSNGANGASHGPMNSELAPKNGAAASTKNGSNAPAKNGMSAASRSRTATTSRASR